MNLTSKQWFQIISGAISSLITAGALFTALFGETMTLKIIACLGLANIMLSSIGAALSGVDSSAKDVSDAAKNKSLSPTAQVAVLNAAGDVPGTQKVVNPMLSADPATSGKVTSQ